MEKDTRRTPEPLSPKVRRMMERINRRVRRVNSNPNATPEQIREVEMLANLTKITLDRGNPLTLDFGRELIDLSDPLMVPEKAAEEQKPEEG